MPRLRLLPRSGLEPAQKLAPIGLPTNRPAPGDRRIALALCDAQAAGRAPLVHASGPARVQEYSNTIEEILVLARRRGWNHVFKTLKSKGLLEEQTLGHVVARWTPRDRRAEALTVGPRAGFRIVPSRAPSRTG